MLNNCIYTFILGTLFYPLKKVQEDFLLLILPIPRLLQWCQVTWRTGRFEPPALWVVTAAKVLNVSQRLPLRGPHTVTLQCQYSLKQLLHKSKGMLNTRQ